jgi:hypothetical protein
LFYGHHTKTKKYTKLQDSSKFTQIGILIRKYYHLAALSSSKISNGGWKLNAPFAKFEYELFRGAATSAA